VTQANFDLFNASLENDNMNITISTLAGSGFGEIELAFYDINNDTWVTYEEYIEALTSI
jgi:hypothetical protein